jgi:signal transduction histidine kinase
VLVQATVAPFFLITNRYAFLLSFAGFLSLGGLLLNKYNLYRASKYLLIYVMNSLILFTGIVRGLNSGILFLAPVIVIILFVFLRESKRELYINLSILIVILVIITWYSENNQALLPFGFRETKIYYLFNLMLSAVLAVILGNEIFQLFQRYSKVIEKINETQNMVFSIIGHDLRSPVATSISLSGMAVNKEISREDFDHFVVDLHKNNQFLLQTLNNLLYWGASQMKGFSTDKRLFNLYQTLKDVVDFNAVWAQSKMIDLEIVVDIDGSQVFADPNHVELVLRNLVSNALKFTPKGGKIRVKAKNVKQGMCISVSDSGNGITPEEWTDIKKDRITKSKRGSQNEVGTGLGLGLIIKMLEVNKSKLELKKSDLGGSELYFILPTTKKFSIV